MLIPKQVFNVSKLASRDPTRYAINGVQIKRTKEGRCAAVTTDGRRLIEVTWDDEPLRPDFPAVGLGSVDPVADFSTIVSLKQWDEAGKAIPKYRMKPVLENCLLDETSANGKVQMATTDLENPRQIGGEPVEGHFPKYDEIIPKYRLGEDAVEIGVNPRLLAEVCKVVEAAATSEESRGVRLVIPTTLGFPMTVDAHCEGVEATALLMPVGLGGYVDTLPDGRPIQTKVEAASGLFDACESFVRAFYKHYQDLQTSDMRLAYSFAVEVLERTGWKLDDLAGEVAAEEAETPEAAEEVEETPQEAPAGPEGVENTPEPVTPQETPQGPEESPPESKGTTGPVGPEGTSEVKRITVKRLRNAPDKVAPVSGARCRSCGASAHRAMFSPQDTWVVVDGAAFCTRCAVHQINAVQAGKAVA